MTTKTKVLNPTRHPLHAFIGKDREHARLTAVRATRALRHLSDPAG